MIQFGNDRKICFINNKFVKEIYNGNTKLLGFADANGLEFDNPLNPGELDWNNNILFTFTGSDQRNKAEVHWTESEKYADVSFYVYPDSSCKIKLPIGRFDFGLGAIRATSSDPLIVNNYVEICFEDIYGNLLCDSVIIDLEAYRTVDTEVGPQAYRYYWTAKQRWSSMNQNEYVSSGGWGWYHHGGIERETFPIYFEIENNILKYYFVFDFIDGVSGNQWIFQNNTNMQTKTLSSIDNGVFVRFKSAAGEDTKHTFRFDGISALNKRYPYWGSSYSLKGRCLNIQK